MRESNLSSISDSHIVTTIPFPLLKNKSGGKRIGDIFVVYLVRIYLNVTLYIYIQCGER